MSEMNCEGTEDIQEPRSIQGKLLPEADIYRDFVLDFKLEYVVKTLSVYIYTRLQQHYRYCFLEERYHSACSLMSYEVGVLVPGS